MMYEMKFTAGSGKKISGDAGADEILRKGNALIGEM